jgi:membrane protease YdiL (CAAX protease family)
MFIAPQYNWKGLGISFNSHTSLVSVGWIAGLGSAILVVARMSSKKQINFLRYPQMRVEAWDMRLVLKYCFSVAVYFLGQEMLFRGLLLFPLAYHFGFWFAIAISTGLCTVSYLSRGAPETIAVLVFSPLFCYITLQTGTIWASWIIHSIVAIAYSMQALRYHPAFSIVWNRKPVADECEL